LVALYTGNMPVHDQMVLALVAYFTYAINAGQFLLKLRAARLQHASTNQQSAVHVTSQGAHA